MAIENSSNSPFDPSCDSSLPSSHQIALTNVAVDIGKTAARLGWDHTPSLYALVVTRTLLGQPGLSADIAAQVCKGWDGSEEHLSAIVQEDLAEDGLEEMLARPAWLPQVQGAALTVEHLVVSPEVEEQAPEDPKEALKFILNHPSRTDVRLTVGALRSSEPWCALRTKTLDSDDKVGQDSNFLPNLVETLLLSLDTEGTVETEGTPDEPRNE